MRVFVPLMMMGLSGSASPLAAFQALVFPPGRRTSPRLSRASSRKRPRRPGTRNKRASSGLRYISKPIRCIKKFCVRSVLPAFSPASTVVSSEPAWSGIRLAKRRFWCGRPF